MTSVEYSSYHGRLEERRSCSGEESEDAVSTDVVNWWKSYEMSCFKKHRAHATSWGSTTHRIFVKKNHTRLLNSRCNVVFHSFTLTLVPAFPMTRASFVARCTKAAYMYANMPWTPKGVFQILRTKKAVRGRLPYLIEHLNG